MTMKTNKLFLSVLLIICTLSATAFAKSAEDITKDCDIVCTGISKDKICDNSVATHSEGNNVTLSVTSSENIGGIYIKYNNHAPGGGMLNGNTPIAQNGFVHEFIEIGGTASAELCFTHADICDIFIYSEGDIPNGVQKWEKGNPDTDILLCATHSDDDQLFFAGLLPYYAGYRGANVRVAYFINHYDTYNRTHELLDGLWHCGVKNYPDISPFPDGYSESFDGALNYLENHSYSYGDILDFQKSLLEKYKPLVAVLHDFNGEYGHGAHILNTKSFIEACNDEGTYMPEKIYVHLYEENPIVLPIDEPLEIFDGNSPFNVSQQAFDFHKSQHWTWFYGWIYGKGSKITSSSQINTYNPAQFGLYSSQVGEDLNKNDLLENITTYSERNKAQENTEKNDSIDYSSKSVIENTVQNSNAAKNKKEFSPFWLLPLIIIFMVILSMVLINTNKKKR